MLLQALAKAPTPGGAVKTGSFLRVQKMRGRVSVLRDFTF